MVVPRSSALLPQPFFPPSLPFSLCSVFIFIFYLGGGLLHLVGHCIHYMIDTGTKQVMHEILAYFTNTFFIFYFTFNS